MHKRLREGRNLRYDEIVETLIEIGYKRWRSGFDERKKKNKGIDGEEEEKRKAAAMVLLEGGRASLFVGGRIRVDGKFLCSSN